MQTVLMCALRRCQWGGGEKNSLFHLITYPERSDCLVRFIQTKRKRKKNRSCVVYITTQHLLMVKRGGRSIQLLSILRIVCEFIGCYELPSFPSYIRMQKARCWGSLQNNHETLTPEGVSIYIDNDGVSRETDKQNKKRVILFNFFLIFAIVR